MVFGRFDFSQKQSELMCEENEDETCPHCYEQLKCGLKQGGSGHQSQYKKEEENDNENEEQDFGKGSSPCSDPRESEQPGYDGNDKEKQRPFQHTLFS